MNKLMFLFLLILLILTPKLASSLSLGASPASLNMMNKSYSNLRIFNSNYETVKVSFFSSYYTVLVGGKIENSTRIPARSSIVIHVKKLVCKDDTLLIKFVDDSDIAPSIKVRLLCRSKILHNQSKLKFVRSNKKPDPFIGMIIVLSIVALAVTIKARF